MTNAWIDWFHIFIIHVNTDSIVMWVTLPSNAGWDCFKTRTLQEILRIQNLLRVEHCAFLEVIRLFQKVGCARNKLSVSHSSTESENHLFGHLTEIWMVCPPLELWDLIVSVLGNISRVSDRSGKPREWWSQTPQVSQQNRCDKRHWCCSF